MKLSPGKLCLWFTFLNEIEDGKLLTEYRALLPADEVERLERYRFDTHKKRYLAGRALLRTILSHYTGMNPASIRLAREGHGRPYLPQTGKHPSPQFSLSYTDGLVAVALVAEGLVGLDVENISAPIDCLEIAAAYFSPTEYHELAQLPGSLMKKRFFEFWTLKEAYLKARGLGLNLPLEEVSFTFPEKISEPIQSASTARQEDRNWQLRLLNPSDLYQAALCVRQDASAPFKLCITKSIPLVSESEFKLAKN
jgi:4'-phosphopantetheinyl transferase